jgi:uncharacterized protein (DUF302 family)
VSGAHTVALDLSQTDAIDAVTAALSAQGFGVLTTIDVRATLKAKLGEDVEDYTILGACNPALAHQALSAEPEIGLLLPCNVVVRADGDDRSVVAAIDPEVSLGRVGNDALAPLAVEVKERLRRVLDAVAAVVRPSHDDASGPAARVDHPAPFG